ncbi:hypothetical protein M758_5G051800 [Ceratodon purpureus]|nr:hypothetical protein M758_5G051800 [Ceratodon purpureus]
MVFSMLCFILCGFCSGLVVDDTDRIWTHDDSWIGRLLCLDIKKKLNIWL